MCPFFFWTALVVSLYYLTVYYGSGLFIILDYPKMLTHPHSLRWKTEVRSKILKWQNTKKKKKVKSLYTLLDKRKL